VPLSAPVRVFVHVMFGACRKAETVFEILTWPYLRRTRRDVMATRIASIRCLPSLFSSRRLAQHRRQANTAKASAGPGRGSTVDRRSSRRQTLNRVTLTRRFRASLAAQLVAGASRARQRAETGMGAASRRMKPRVRLVASGVPRRLSICLVGEQGTAGRPSC
jgi:hypothetical protein